MIPGVLPRFAFTLHPLPRTMQPSCPVLTYPRPPTFRLPVLTARRQMFTKDIYFWGRPSSAGDGYDATSSAGSNKGPTNQEYLDEVKARIDTFLVHHPYLNRADVPAEMVTASGSGLDPNITPQCAYVQVKRVAQARGLREEQVRAIVDKSIEKPLLGLLGTEKVNVLKLNIALEESNK